MKFSSVFMCNMCVCVCACMLKQTYAFVSVCACVCVRVTANRIFVVFSSTCVEVLLIYVCECVLVLA